jgi:DNA repair protein RadD
VSGFAYRNYQTAAIAAVLHYLGWHSGNPLVELPTGTGKSFIAAGLIHHLSLQGWRILLLSHVREIIEQDARALRLVWPNMPDGMMGINSDALGERDTDSPIVMVTVQSVFRNPRR